MNKILIVDVDNGTLSNFKDIFNARSDDLEVLTAETIKGVPSFIKSQDVNTVIIDLKMPDESDLEILTSINKNYPELPVIVMTGFGTPDMASEIKALSNCQYFEKPIDIETISQKIIEDLSTALGGQIHGISLASFLQMSEMEKTTCKLKVTAKGKVGFLYLSDGKLIAAETGKLTKEQAAYEIISWDKTVIDFSDGSHGPNDVDDWEIFDLTYFQRDSTIVEDPGFEPPGIEEIGFF